MAKLIYNRQNDVSWNLETMTHPEGQKRPDYLGVYGCLVTCLANIIQFIMRKQFLPKDLNDQLKEYKGYKYLLDRECPNDQASFLVWEKFLDLYRYLEVKSHVKEYHASKNFHYIARIQSPVGGHYINVLDKKCNLKACDDYICFDPWDGATKIIEAENITFFHRVIYRGKQCQG